MSFLHTNIHIFRERAFYFSALAVAASFPFSEALVSIFSGVLLLQAIILQSWKHQGGKSGHLASLLSFLGIYGVYLIWMVNTSDVQFALYELKKVIFWLIFPLGIFLSPRLTAKELYHVLGVFVLAVFLSSIISTGKLILHDYFDVFSNRTVSYISHIRFSFQIILSIIILSWIILTENPVKKSNLRWISYGLTAWFVYFLFINQSLLGIFVFAGTLGLALIYYIFRSSSYRLKLIFLSGLMIIIAVPVVYVYGVFRDYYDFKTESPETVEWYTPSGNHYEHNFQTVMRENGHLVFIYICHDELRREWNKRSHTGYDDPVTDYPLHVVLIRYLTSLGYRKDSAGVSRLSDEDISLIEQGVTNYKFKNRFFSIYPRVYETVWEIDQYLKTGDPNNKSLSQRIEYVKASVTLFSQYPLFGIGTGSAKMKYEEIYRGLNAKLHTLITGSSHNQYLNYLVKFGVTGFILIHIFIFLPVFKEDHQRNFIVVLFLVSISIANLGDANLESHMGLSFFTFFYSLMIWNSTPEMKESDIHLPKI